MLGYIYLDFQNPLYMASRQLMITRIAAAGASVSPLPCQAWHGFKFTNAHRVEGEVGADGHASAPPSGAAAAAPPAGALTYPTSRGSLCHLPTWDGVQDSMRRKHGCDDVD
jgi:hypothetical protein